MSPEAKRRAIMEAVAQIPPGCVLSYGKVAELAGLPGRARLVGNVLKTLPPGSKLPWHRVVNAAGEIRVSGDRVIESFATPGLPMCTPPI